MKHISKSKFTVDFLSSNQVDDSYCFRHVALKLVGEMTIAELHKLIQFTKIDPDSKESVQILSSRTDSFKSREINELRDEGVVLFCAKVDLP